MSRNPLGSTARSHCIALHCVMCRVRRPQWGMTKSDQSRPTETSHILPLTLQRSFCSLPDHLEIASMLSNASLDVVVLQCLPSFPILGQLQPRLPTPSHEIDQGILPTRCWSPWRPEPTKWPRTQHPTCPASIPAPRNMASPSPLSPPLLVDPINKLSLADVLVYRPSSSPHPIYPTLLELTALAVVLLILSGLLFPLPRAACRR